MRRALRFKVLVTLSGGLAMLLALGGCTTAGVRPPPAETLQAQAVIDHWVQSLGGAAVVEKLRGMEVRAVVEMAEGTKFDIHTWQTAENFYRSELTFSGGINLIEAYDGKVAWRSHTVFGFGFVPPGELATTLRRDSVHAALTVNADYPERRLLADESVGERRCRVLRLVPRDAPAEKWFFDEENGRLLRIQRDSKDGAVAAETLDFSDYREVGGMMLSFVLNVRTSAQVYTVRRVEMVPNPLVGEALWTPPAAALREGLKVAQILDRYVEGQGGPAPMASIRSRVTEIEIEIPASGIKYRRTLSQKQPNLVLIEDTLPGLGRLVRGYDGVTGWVNSELEGYRELKGVELRQIAENADLRTNLLLPERCSLRRWLGPREVNGRRTVAVALATLQGPAGRYFFDEENGRLLRIESAVTAGPQGTLPVTIDFSDFRTVDRIVMPFVSSETNPAATSVTKIISVKHNVTLPDALFRPRKGDDS